MMCVTALVCDKNSGWDLYGNFVDICEKATAGVSLSAIAGAPRNDVMLSE